MAKKKLFKGEKGSGGVRNFERVKRWIEGEMQRVRATEEGCQKRSIERRMEREIRTGKDIREYQR